MPKFCFCSISCEPIDRISPNFIYAFILTRYSMGLLHVIFPKFVPELWPLIYAKISFPLNILRTIWHIYSPNFKYVFIFTRSSLRLLHIILRIFVPELWPLIYAKISFPLNILRLIDRISQNFIYAFILIRSTLRLLHIVFLTFVRELWSLIYAKISFLLNNLRTNRQNFSKFYICIHIDRI